MMSNTSKTRVGEAREALLRLSAADPLLKHAGKQFEFDCGADTPTSALGSLGQTFVDHFDQIDAASKAKLFATVEELFTIGSPAVGDAVATGFLEAVATRAEAAKRYEAVTRLFGPRACEYVNAWNVFCGVDTPPLPVASNETDGTKEQRSADGLEF